MNRIKNWVRPNIAHLKPYSSARHEYEGEARVHLDANENPFPNHINRYPDPLQQDLKAKISEIKGVPVDSIFIGNGSDEAIDLITRIFCQPRQNNVITMSPTYGMYRVYADINDVVTHEVSLSEDYQIDLDAARNKVNSETRVIWLCSPNNPTGNLLSNSTIETIIQESDCIVVIDEAYIDFADQPSWIERLKEYDNLIVLQTLSKAWAMAGIRIGMAFASPYIISLMNNVKPPYNVSILNQEKALEILKDNDFDQHKDILLRERNRMNSALKNIEGVITVYPSSANFLLVKFKDSQHIFDDLKAEGIVVRNRNRVHLCEDSLRLTIGLPTENDELLAALTRMSKA